MKSLFNFSRPAGRAEYFAVAFLASFLNNVAAAVLEPHAGDIATSMVGSLGYYPGLTLFIGLCVLIDAIYCAVISAVAFRRARDLGWSNAAPIFMTLVLVGGTGLGFAAAFIPDFPADVVEKLPRGLLAIPHLIFVFKAGAIAKAARAAKLAARNPSNPAPLAA